jgi:hypothetical protein
MIDWMKSVQAWDMAGWVTALAAIVGLAFVGWQIRSARNIQREATAHDIWMNYERLGLEYPMYANPELSAFDYKGRKVDGKRQKFYAYEWFVSFMTLACDAVLLIERGRWEGVVERNLEYHERYLTSEIYEKENLEFQSPTIKTMIRKLKNKKKEVSSRQSPLNP